MVNKPGSLAIFQQWCEWSTNLVRSPSFNNGRNDQQNWFARHLSTMAQMVNKPGLLAEWSTNLVRSPSFNNGANGQQPGSLTIFQQWREWSTNLVCSPSFNNGANGQQTWFARHLSTMVRMVNKPGSLAIFQQWHEWSTNDLWSDIILAFILKM